MPKKGAHSKVAAYLTHHVDASSKSQNQIAEEAGFPRSNIISMMKMGMTKVPIARVPALAKSLDVDPVEFFRMCMEEYSPELLAVADEMYGRDKMNAGETELLQRLRLQTGGKSFRLNSDHKRMIDDLAKELSR